MVDKFLLHCLESWSLNPTELNWHYCCTSSTKSSCEISSDSSITEECLTNSKPHDWEQSCNGFCYYSGERVCPNNPGYCVDVDDACDGRKENACECSAPFKNSPFYKSPDTCISNRLTLYCGEREGAKFQNRQCYRPDDNHEYYQCLNRKDIGENVLRTKPIFDSEKQVSTRKGKVLLKQLSIKYPNLSHDHFLSKKKRASNLFVLQLSSSVLEWVSLHFSSCDLLYMN